MIKDIGYYPIFGLPLVAYLGILTLLSFIFTATISVLNVKYHNSTIPFRWHPRMAIISLCLAVIHGLLAILIYF